MGVDKKWLATWFAKLIAMWQGGAGGQHSSSGDGAMHIGQASGPVINQHNSNEGAVQVGGNVIVTNVTNHHTIHLAPVTRPQSLREPLDTRTKETKAAQSRVLALLDQVPDREGMLDWMYDKFKTTTVIALDDKQLYRLRRYMEAIVGRQGT